MERSSLTSWRPTRYAVSRTPRSGTRAREQDRHIHRADPRLDLAHDVERRVVSRHIDRVEPLDGDGLPRRDGGGVAAETRGAVDGCQDALGAGEEFPSRRVEVVAVMVMR